MAINFSRTAADYAYARPGFDARLYERLRQLRIGTAGQRILDVGAGTGLLGEGFAGCDVTEVEPSMKLLVRSGARHRVGGVAEMLPFADDTFDVVTAAQCWHWFDRAAAPREIGRVLKPGGRLAIVYQTPLPVPGNLVDASEQLILQFRPNWRHAGNTGINGQALKDLTTHGFGEIESFTFDAQIEFTRKTWHGYVRTTSAVLPTLDAEELAEFDRRHLEMLGSWGERVSALHRVFVAVGRKADAR